LAQLGDLVPLGPLRQHAEQALADAEPAGIGAHADQLQSQAAPAASEFVLEHAGEDVAGKPLLVDGGELSVQRRIAPRSRQAPFDVGATRAALDRGVDGDHARKVFRRQGPYGHCRGSEGFHLGLPLKRAGNGAHAEA
jgi:hypothetical protein